MKIHNQIYLNYVMRLKNIKSKNLYDIIKTKKNEIKYYEYC